MALSGTQRQSIGPHLQQPTQQAREASWQRLQSALGEALEPVEHHERLRHELESLRISLGRARLLERRRERFELEKEACDELVECMLHLLLQSGRPGLGQERGPCFAASLERRPVGVPDQRDIHIRM
mgnify:FL=1